MINPSESGTSSSCRTIRAGPGKNDTEDLDKSLSSHRRSVSRSTTESSQFRHSDTASEGSRWEESQTEISIHDQQCQNGRGLDSKPPGRPSPRADAFSPPLEEISRLSIQPGLEEFEALENKITNPNEEQHPEGVQILRGTLGKGPEDPYFLDVPHYATQPQRLIDRVFLKAVRSCGPDSRRDQLFYPPSVLADLLDIRTVREELHQSRAFSQEKVNKLSAVICTETHISLPSGTEVCQSYRPIFALLVLTERLEWIEHFLADGVSNIDLPLLSVLHRDGTLKTLQRKDSSTNRVLRCFLGWPLHKLKEFSDLQWQFIAHSFRRSEYNDVASDHLHDLSVLPFIKPVAKCGCPSSDGVVSLGEGGSGQVMKCFIHPDFHNFPDADDIRRRGVAVKRLKLTTSDAVFERELNILGKFCGDGANEHVVSLLGTYKQSGYHHLVFPRAEMNLFEYWAKHRTAPLLDHDGIIWIAEQFAGLTEALQQVHRHKTFSVREETPQVPSLSTVGSGVARGSAGKGRKSRKSKDPAHAKSKGHGEVTVEGLHGDVKPENLLFFITSISGVRGIIKLSDFGEAEMTPSARGSRSRPNASVTMTYRAPEYDLRPDSVRPASDVWSFGCVFLEFVAWILGGHDYVHQFARKRVKDDIFDDGANLGSDTFFELATSVSEGQPRLGLRVKPEVADFIEELHTHKNCTSFLHDILDVIQDRMLLADSTHRKCDFKARLQTLHTKCQTDPLYATEARPRKRTAHPNILVELRHRDVEEKQSGKISFNMHRLRKHQGPTKRSERGNEGDAMWKPRVLSF